jgi:hypothetical protein
LSFDNDPSQARYDYGAFQLSSNNSAAPYFDAGPVPPVAPEEQSSTSVSGHSLAVIDAISNWSRSSVRFDHRDMVATATDCLRFCQMLLNDGVFDDVGILGAGTVTHDQRSSRADLPW